MIIKAQTTEVLAPHQIGHAESRPWGNLYVTEGALPLLGLEPRQPLPTLQPGPKVDKFPSIEMTIGTFGEVVEGAMLDDASPALVVGKYDERFRGSIGQVFGLLDEKSPGEPATRIDQLTGTLSSDLREFLPVLPIARAEYQMRMSYAMNVYLSVLASVGFFTGEGMYSGNSNFVDYLGTVAICATGMITSKMELRDRRRALLEATPGIRFSAYSLAARMVTDLAAAPERWNSQEGSK